MKQQLVEPIHWSFWLISLVALAWNLMGCINFLMQMNPDALSGYSEAARSLIESRPVWATSAFAIAVFGGALGCLFLLLKKSAAFNLFIVSLLGVITTNLYTFSVTVSSEIVVGSLLSLVVALFLIWYSKRAERMGWMR